MVDKTALFWECCSEKEKYGAFQHVSMTVLDIMKETIGYSEERGLKTAMRRNVINCVAPSAVGCLCYMRLWNGVCGKTP